MGEIGGALFVWRKGRRRSGRDVKMRKSGRGRRVGGRGGKEEA